MDKAPSAENTPLCPVPEDSTNTFDESFGSYRPLLKRQSSSIKRPFHRKSSVIDATTGRKIRKVYSFWEENETLEEAAVEDALEEEDEVVLPVPPPAVQRQSPLWEYIKACTRRRGVKASLTYLIASLAVYSSYISSLLGNSDSKHLVCTIVVYFHPSRSRGSMIQSLVFVAMSLAFASIVSIGLMLLSELCQEDGEPDGFTNGVILTICSASLGFVSYMKQKVSKPTFNTACSLCAIVIVSCVIKEGSLGGVDIPWSKISSIFTIVLTGCLTSALSCVLLWPTSGTGRLRSSLGSTTSSLSILLREISNGFLKDTPMTTTELTRLQNNVRSLNTPLEEAKFELYLTGRSQQYDLLEQLVKSSDRMLSSISGLRRSVEFKRELLGESSDSNVTSEVTSLHTVRSDRSSISDSFVSCSTSSDGSSSASSALVAEVPKELFDLFVYHLGPSMRSFTHTMRQILAAVPFTGDGEGMINTNIPQFQESLANATKLFEENESKALQRVYEQPIFKEETDFEDKLDQEQVAASSANFAFSMIHFSNELSTYLHILQQLQDLGDIKGRLKFPAPFSTSIGVKEPRVKGGYSAGDKPDSFGYKLWSLWKSLWKVDYQFGIRVGLGAMVIGSFAYMDSTKELFNEWHGEWVLITYCIIMNKSVGGTNMTVKWRFMGTLMGAVLAILTWECFFPFYIPMALTGFLVALPCFHIVLDWPANNAFGRFILLTYNLSVLYSYSVAVGKGGPGTGSEGGTTPLIWEIAWHRFIGVSLGVVWAVVVTMTLFPVTARSRLRQCLSSLWMRLGLIWKEGPLAYTKDQHGDYRLVGIPHEQRALCWTKLAEAQTMLKQAPMEVRLKGPFPTKTYKKMLDMTLHILDAVENMSSIIDFDTLLSGNDHLVMVNLRSELSELQNRVFLICYMLSSALRLGIPTASKPASTAHAMERLLVKLSKLRDRTSKLQPLTNEDFVLFYTYTIVTNSFAHQLDRLLDLVSDLYGAVDVMAIDES